MRIQLGGATTFGGASAATPAPTSGSSARRRLVTAPSRRTSAHRHLTASAAMAEAHDGRRVGMMGGVRDAPAGRENDLEVIELARFAVAEHNSKNNAMLEFERLVKVRHQVVAGSMHHLTVEVKEAGGGKKLYEAKVWEKAWENFKQLQSFQPVGDAVVA